MPNFDLGMKEGGSEGGGMIFDWQVSGFTKDKITSTLNPFLQHHFNKPKDEKWIITRRIYNSPGNYKLTGKIKYEAINISQEVENDEIVLEIFGTNKILDELDIYYKRVEFIKKSDWLEFEINDIIIHPNLTYNTRFIFMGKALSVWLGAIILTSNQSTLDFYLGEKNEIALTTNQYPHAVLYVPSVEEYFDNDNPERRKNSYFYIQNAWFTDLERNKLLESNPKMPLNNTSYYYDNKNIKIEQPKRDVVQKRFVKGKPEEHIFTISCLENDLYFPGGIYSDEGKLEVGGNWHIAQNNADPRNLVISIKPSEILERSTGSAAIVFKEPINLYKDASYTQIIGNFIIFVEFHYDTPKDGDD